MKTETRVKFRLSQPINQDDFERLMLFFFKKEIAEIILKEKNQGVIIVEHWSPSDLAAILCRIALLCAQMLIEQGHSKVGDAFVIL